MSGNETVGRRLVAYICLFIVLGGTVLFIADRLGFGGAIYLQHLAMSRCRRAQCGRWLAPVIAHASSLSP